MKHAGLSVFVLALTIWLAGCSSCNDGAAPAKGGDDDGPKDLMATDGDSDTETLPDLSWMGPRNPHYMGPLFMLPHPKIDQGFVLPEGQSGAPAWVTQGCHVFYDKDTQVLCAKGKMSGSKNPNLGRATATARARVALSERFGERISALRQHFVQSVHVHEPPPATDVLTSRTIVNAIADDMWIAPDGTIYVLVGMREKPFFAHLKTTDIDDDEFKEFMEQYKKYLFHVGLTVEEAAAIDEKYMGKVPKTEEGKRLPDGTSGPMLNVEPGHDRSKQHD